MTALLFLRAKAFNQEESDIETKFAVQPNVIPPFCKSGLCISENLLQHRKNPETMKLSEVGDDPTLGLFQYLLRCG